MDDNAKTVMDEASCYWGAHRPECAAKLIQLQERFAQLRQDPDYGDLELASPSERKAYREASFVDTPV
ncbi:MAG: hypothetical protein ACOYNL_10805 [Rickettsiales bacterium]